MYWFTDIRSDEVVKSQLEFKVSALGVVDFGIIEVEIGAVRLRVSMAIAVPGIRDKFLTMMHSRSGTAPTRFGFKYKGFTELKFYGVFTRQGRKKLQVKNEKMKIQRKSKRVREVCTLMLGASSFDTTIEIYEEECDFWDKKKDRSACGFAGNDDSESVSGNSGIGDSGAVCVYGSAGRSDCERLLQFCGRNAALCVLDSRGDYGQ